MKIKFTKASQKDKTLVTVQLSQFEGTELDFVPNTFSKGEECILVIEGQPTIFRINRVKTNGKGSITAASHTFPRFLRLPSVGRPVFANVTDVR
jgi:hypothetical protein